MGEQTIYTPGPWRVAANKYADDAPIIEMGPPARRRVLYLTSPDDPPDEYDAEWEANARLIAAAPDLLDACRAAEQYVAYVLEEGDGAPDLLTTLRAAIALATAAGAARRRA